MESTGVILQNVLKRLEQKGIFERSKTICPICQKNMIRHVHTEPTTFDYSVCPDCGIEANGREVQHGIDQVSQDQSYQRQVQKEMWRGVIQNSIVMGDLTMTFGKRFKSFEVETDRAKEIVKQAFNYAQDMIKNPLHVILTGQTGSGKTHLAVSMMHKYMMSGIPNKKGLMINFSDYVALKRLAMVSNNEETNELMRKTDRYMKLADILIIDDIGAERGNVAGNVAATNFESGLLLNLLNAREGRRLIITTNLESDELGDKYDPRTYSRMAHQSNGIQVDLPDYRVHGTNS